MKKWVATEGAPIPLGVTWVEQEQAYNFAIHSTHAERVTLLAYRADDMNKPALKYELSYLRNKSGRIWHCRVPKARLNGARYYVWSIGGPRAMENSEWHAFDEQKMLLDPYARAVYFPEEYCRGAAMRPGSNVGKAPMGVLMAEEPFDWSGERRPFHESDLVIYEMHVRGFTRRPNSGVSDGKRGTFAGVVEQIPYLKELGVTAIELMPVFQFDPGEGNYWGYMTLNFFTPHNVYAATNNPVEQPNEFRAMVKALHNADIEVILDVVYNHTSEGNHEGPTFSFKGIDNSSYYLYSGDPRVPYANFSGTGNTLNCANRYVRRMILDSLRYWANEMHVDGFRFDLASAFSRRSDGSINWSDPPIFGEIRADPDLGHVRLIAEPWDAGGAYQLGESFPGLRWMQWNGRFRDDVRRFVRGDAGMVPSLMYRLYGSDDLFPDDRVHAFHAYQSINYVNSHDGFTLYDQVSYNERHNEANGHDNTDGTADNFSWNCGHEGDRNLPKPIAALRRRQAKNICCLLFLANGTPMFLSGDEFLHTQQGNNNPYNQDNETTWLDWDQLENNREFFQFFRQMIAFRKSHPTLCRSRFWREDVRWYGSGRDVDMSPKSRQLAYYLDGAAEDDDDLYVMINADQRDLSFTIHEGDPTQWRR
ncbi:MAG TPA: isoamylase, partial [Pirellulaceae bacterium]|nr:isoamylase [Pirellulaceae bacterium]